VNDSLNPCVNENNYNSCNQFDVTQYTRINW